MKDLSFARYLKTDKSSRSNALGLSSKKKAKKGVVAWQSGKKGTYIKAIHGELNNE